ncbi:MAG: hypothetical protein QJR14_04830 [Bacillota bacterium]|nr:hypothetical protein [Bacillota bacterium]
MDEKPRPSSRRAARRAPARRPAAGGRTAGRPEQGRFDWRRLFLSLIMGLVVLGLVAYYALPFL